MIRRTITLESKEFGPLVGKTLTVNEPENMADCAALVANGESDIVARFSESIVRAQNNLARTAVKGILKANPTDAAKALMDLQAKIDGYKYSERAAGTGTSAPKGPKTAKGRQDKAAASSGNKLFEKCLADDTFLQRMVKQGIVDTAEFDAWKSARDEASKPAETAPVADAPVKA